MYVPDNRHILNFGIGFKSEWQVTLTDAKTGRVKLHLPWHKNTILDAGLNRRLVSSSNFVYYSSPTLFKYIAIGTDNTAPATTDTALIAEVSRKIYNATLSTYSFATAYAPYFIVGAQWGTTEGNGDLKEVALCESSSGGVLWSRNLFRDEGGNPITVTKTSADILTVLCKTTIQRTSDTPYSVTLDGRTVKGLILNTGLQNAVRLTNTSSEWWNTSNRNLTAGTNNTDPSPTQVGIQGSNLGTSDSVVYSAGISGPPDFYREGLYSFLSYQGIGSIGEVCSSSSDVLMARHTFNAAIVKDDTKQLDLTVRITLSRL